MPPVKPSEKTGHEGEWWREDKSDQETNQVDPSYERKIDKAADEHNAFEESQLPVHNRSV